jgi:hypothetical protein
LQLETRDDGTIPSTAIDDALLEWEKRYSFTSNLWRELYDEDYQIGKFGPTDRLASTYERYFGTEPTSEFGKQAVDAVLRQVTFSKRILALSKAKDGTMLDQGGEWMTRAVDRYGKFLMLVAQKPDLRVVPTLDIDLIWHAHMLSPYDYQRDCLRIAGRVLNHDDAIPDEKLEENFEATKDEWKDTFREEYTLQATWATRPRSKRTKQSSCGGCASCNWGSPKFHESLPHKDFELQEIGVVEPSVEDIPSEEYFGSEDPTTTSTSWWSDFSSSDGSDSSSCGGGCGGCGD